MKYMEAEELKEILESSGKRVQVIDVRDGDFNRGGHIKGAVNVPSSSFGEAETTAKVYSELVDKNAEAVVFHCMKSQVRGPQAAKTFQAWLQCQTDAAPLDVYVLKGGFERWHHSYSSENAELIEDMGSLDEE